VHIILAVLSRFLPNNPHNSPIFSAGSAYIETSSFFLKSSRERRQMSNKNVAFGPHGASFHAQEQVEVVGRHQRDASASSAAATDSYQRADATPVQAQRRKRGLM